MIQTYSLFSTQSTKHPKMGIKTCSFFIQLIQLKARNLFKLTDICEKFNCKNKNKMINQI